MAMVFLLLLLPSVAQAQDFSVILKASSLRPFAGELLDISIEIQLPIKKECKLSIPWLTEEGKPLILKRTTWIEQNSKASDAALPVRVGEKLIYAQPVNEKTWILRIRSKLHPEVTEAFNLSPVKIEQDGKSVSSGSLKVTPRSVPIAGKEQVGWYLGVGNGEITARWLLSDRNSFSWNIGQEGTFELEVKSDTFDLAAIPRPDLARLFNWDPLRVRLEAAGEGRNNAATFIWRARPGRLGLLQLPPIRAYAWNPATEKYDNYSIAVPTVHVEVGSSITRRQLPALPYSPVGQFVLGLVTPGKFLLISTGSMLAVLLVIRWGTRSRLRSLGALGQLRQSAWEAFHAGWKKESKSLPHQRMEHATTALLSELLDVSIKRIEKELPEHLRAAVDQGLLKEEEQVDLDTFMNEGLELSFSERSTINHDLWCSKVETWRLKR